MKSFGSLTRSGRFYDDDRRSWQFVNLNYLRKAEVEIGKGRVCSRPLGRRGSIFLVVVAIVAALQSRMIVTALLALAVVGAAG